MLEKSCQLDRSQLRKQLQIYWKNDADQQVYVYGPILEKFL